MNRNSVNKTSSIIGVLGDGVLGNIYIYELITVGFKPDEFNGTVLLFQCNSTNLVDQINK